MVSIKIKSKKQVVKEVKKILAKEDVDSLEVVKIDAIFGGAVVVCLMRNGRVLECVSESAIITDYDSNDKIQVAKKLNIMHKELVKHIKSNFDIKITIKQ